MSDPMLPMRSNYCKCAVCGVYFNAPSIFTLHRVGATGDRRCLSPRDMSDRGWSLNARGYWITRKRSEK